MALRAPTMSSYAASAETVLDVGCLPLRCGEQRCSFLAGCPIGVISRGLEPAVEYCPGRGSIRLRWFQLAYIGLCVAAAFASRSVISDRQLHLQLPTRGSQVVSGRFYVVQYQL